MSSLSSHARLACVWEATARKAGNVHPAAAFADMAFADFVASAGAVAPVLGAAEGRPLGATIFGAIRATRAVTAANTNLGIVLLLAPLAACGGRASIDEYRRRMAEVLAATTVEDCRALYRAIRLAVPGGMGTADAEDIADEPTVTLTEAMRLAEGRDLIARQYANGFDDVLGFGLRVAESCWRTYGAVEAAVQRLQLEWLARYPDTLIARKHGVDVAGSVSAEARGLLGQRDPEAYSAWDESLRARGLNPGTTADLVTACLYLMLRLGKMPADAPMAG